MTRNYIKVKDNVVLTKRKSSKYWQAQISTPSRPYIRVTTKQVDFELAKKIALNIYQETQYAIKNGLVISTRSFSSVAKATVIQLQKDIQNSASCKSASDYIRAINNYLVPFFNKTHINTIDQRKLQAFDQYRITMLGKNPSRSTINTHNRALELCFQTAINKGHMLESQKPQLINNGEKVKARPYFNEDECKLMSTKLSVFGKTGHSNKTQQIRELLADYVLMLANTGMRPGIESLNLKWNQMVPIKVGDNRFQVKSTGESTLKISVNGKTGSRTLIARNLHNNTINILYRIKGRFPDLHNLKLSSLFSQDEYVFRLADGNRPTIDNLTKAFRKFLQDYNLLKDEHGQDRTLYSLRHTYATQNILDGVDIHTLAIQMGTSIKMLEQHYSKLQPEMKARSLSGYKQNGTKVSSEVQNLLSIIDKQSLDIELIKKLLEYKN